MRDPDIKRALYEAADIPDPSQTAPPHHAFLLELDLDPSDTPETVDPEPVPNEPVGSLDPVPPRTHTSDSGVRPAPVEAPANNTAALAAVGVFGAMSVLLLGAAALLGMVALWMLL